jgi:hypothetical protein
MIEYTYDQDIINKYLTRRDYLLKLHSRVLQIRLDLHYPQDYPYQPTRDDISNFTDYLNRALTRQNILPGKDKIRFRGREVIEIKHPHNQQIIIVREQSTTSLHPHYHVLILVNGYARQDSYYVFQQALRIWNKIIGQDQLTYGYVNLCNQYGPDHIMIDRNQPDFYLKLEQAYNQALYLAKTHTKEYNPIGSWRVTGTRLPKQTI